MMTGSAIGFRHSAGSNYNQNNTNSNTTNMNPQQIQFANSDAATGSAIAPWASPKTSNYQDLILSAPFAERKYKFPPGETWFRIVPALLGSSKGWMLGVHALNYPGGRHAKALNPKAKCVFDTAYRWCKSNCPESLFSTANREGYKLLADPLCVFWILVEENGEVVSRIVIASGYDGSRGGAPGFGHQLWRLTQERDENQNLIANPVDPAIGLQVGVEKKQPPGARYPSYTLRLGRMVTPISVYLDRMDQAEVSALKPLEEVIYRPDPELEWTLLENVMDPGTVAKIRASQQS